MKLYISISPSNLLALNLILLDNAYAQVEVLCFLKYIEQNWPVADDTIKERDLSSELGQVDLGSRSTGSHWATPLPSLAALFDFLSVEVQKKKNLDPIKDLQTLVYISKV